MEYIGITNEHDFYSQHYLDEIFEGEVSDIIKTEEQESKQREQEIKEAKNKNLPLPQPIKTTWDKLSSLSRAYIQGLFELKNITDFDEYLDSETELCGKLLNVLGFPEINRELRTEFVLPDSGLHLPLLLDVKSDNGLPYLWIFHVTTKSDSAEIEDVEDVDPLELRVPPAQVEKFVTEYGAQARDLKDRNWRDILDKGVFAQEYSPRWVILATPYQWVLIERTKFAQRRLLRFNWKQLLQRDEKSVLKAVSVLLSIRAFVQGNSNQCRLDYFDENSFKHAQGVSSDLKFAMRRSIELLGNEAVKQIRIAREKRHAKFFSDDRMAGELSAELLRYMYRLLFIFFVEARPELSYVPNKDDSYQTSYSLESLRELETVPLLNREDREGTYFHKTISKLFSFLSKGTGDSKNNLLKFNQFCIDRLNSKLFDDKGIKLLKDVVFPNYILQQVIRWMSLTNYTDKKGKNKRSGRISYAHLGVSQLGAVYEALLSYKGFFADDDLYEVKLSTDKEVNELDSAYFVKENDLKLYKDSEKVFEKDSITGELRLKKHEKGSFIYRMAGRSRESSASYYTPEILTKCVVEQAVELLEEQQLNDLPDPKSKAEKILSWRVCEPAMGSAAFLNEATNQLAELYMKYAMKVPGAKSLTQSEYRTELQKVKMYIADRNLFGVDLNPTAVELGEVSIWLNALSSDRFVPSFEGQLICGNSLIGCRREAYYARDLLKSLDEARPHPVGPEGLKDDEIWHFLIPSNGMASYNDADVKKIVPEELKYINAWRKNFTAKFTKEDLQKLQILSGQIESHWQSYARSLRKVRENTTNSYSIYGHMTDGSSLCDMDYAQQEAEFRKIQDKDDLFEFGEFPRLRMIMNYWCSLWFWPIEKWQLLPTRKQFIDDIFEQLNAIKAIPDDINNDTGRFISSDYGYSEGAQSDLFGYSDGVQTELGFGSTDGKPETPKASNKPRLDVVVELTKKLHFLHWPLRFADFFIPEEGGHAGFDLTLGNPPWATVTFESGKILGDLDPRYVIHENEFNAKVIQDVLLGEKDLIDGKSLFERITDAKSYWLESYEFATGSKNFFNDDKLYPELKGAGTDLFKVFLPNIWRNAAPNGVQGILHPETPYTETKALRLREELYHRVRKHFSFANELKLFADVHHETEFSVNVYGEYKAKPYFVSMNNLFIPKTIKESLKENKNEVEGIKDSEGKWNTKGHPERILHYDEMALNAISEVFNTERKAPTLPSIHASSLLTILEHFTECQRLGDMEVYISSMWHETGAQKDGTIKALSGNHTVFPEKPEDVILNGVHMFVGNPLFKIPYDPCDNNLQWSLLDLTYLPDDYLPRCKYLPNVDRTEYLRRMDHVTWSNRPVADYYRLSYREMVGCDSERTLAPGIIPKGYACIAQINTVVFSNNEELLAMSGIFKSVVIDFYIRCLNKGHLHPNVIKSVPIASVHKKHISKLYPRVLGLNCLTQFYKELWEDCYNPIFNTDNWSSEDPVLSHNFFKELTPEWQRNNALRSDLDRRQALLEIDVIVAQAFGLSLHELQTCYRLGFRVMRSYEEETYYDQKGRIVFTPNNSLGAGLPQTAKKGDETMYAVNGGVKDSPIGFEDVMNMKEGTVSKTFLDDTLPEEPQKRTITYYAPFFKKNRVEDYAKAWSYFENLKEE